MATSGDSEEFWELLLGLIQQRSVIPIVGAELLTVQIDGATVPLYRVVAERLLRKYGVPADQAPGGNGLRAHQELNDAVCLITQARPGHDLSGLYLAIDDILEKVIAEQKDLPEPLRQLAAISQFDLFVTTTPDDLLTRALNAVRFGGSPGTDEIEYAPKLSTDRLRDRPERPSSGYTAVLYLFGKASVPFFYAIHDEDALEFAYTLQASAEPRRILSDLRSHNLLLIGCTFADWMSRFFLRMFNSERLSSEQRPKWEFLGGEEATRDTGFTVFLERFSHHSRCYPADAPRFVSELYRRWCERNPVQPVSPADAQGIRDAAAPTGGTIFISYASEDIGAARKLYAELMKIGGDVAWFDKSAIKPGDDWDKAIRAAVQSCAFFVPLLSASTERREEGYFRQEWSDAAERSHRIQGRKFIMPVVIDPGPVEMGRYHLLPDEFKRPQFGHAPAGQPSDELKAEIQDQLRKLRRSRAA